MTVISEESPRRPDLVITPEPSPEEFAALAAALLPLLDGGAADTEEESPPVSAWRAAALREGVSGIAGGARTGWGQPRRGRRG